MAVDFRKKAAGKKTKLAGKSLESSTDESPLIEPYQDGNLYKIPLDSISPDPNQPRKYFDETSLSELAESIKNKGVLQPIIIRKNDNKDIASEFLVVAGERRYRASHMAGLILVPALYSTGDPAEIALIENLQRDDLKPIEEAEAYRKIMESHGYSQGQVSKIVGKSRTTINEVITLTALPDFIKEECRTSDTPKNVLLEIAKRKDPEEMIFLYNKVKNENLTVAKIRKLTRPRPPRVVRDTDVRALEKIKESKKLLHKVRKDDMSSKAKQILWKEVQELYNLVGSFVDK